MVENCIPHRCSFPQRFQRLLWPALHRFRVIAVLNEWVTIINQFEYIVCIQGWGLWQLVCHKLLYAIPSEPLLQVGSSNIVLFERDLLVCWIWNDSTHICGVRDLLKLMGKKSMAISHLACKRQSGVSFSKHPIDERVKFAMLFSSVCTRLGCLWADQVLHLW